MQSFGNLLQEYRKKSNMSLRALAKSLEISPTFLSDIENDRRLPPTSKRNHNIINEIVDLLNLTQFECEQLKLAADKALNERGMISKDFEQYMFNAPKAQVAMRKAIDKNIDDNKWEKIIKIIEEE